MNFKRLSALLLLTCLFVAPLRAGVPIMPPLPDPTPEPQTAAVEPAPTDQESPESTLPAGAVEILVSALANLFSAAP